MSTFACEHCKAVLTDTQFGYVTGCEHYPVDRKAVNQFLLRSLCELDNTLPFLARIAAESGHHTAEPLKRWSCDLRAAISLMLDAKPSFNQSITCVP